MNKTKYLYLLIIFVSLFIGCSQDINIQTEDEGLFEEFSPATTQVSDYDKLSSQDKKAVKFRSYWIQNILKKDIPKLTNEELEISYNRANNPIDYFEMNNGIECFRKTSGMNFGSVVDENYQLVFENDRFGDDGYNIVLDVYYNCGNGDVSFALFGAPFYQNGEWWTFKTVKNIEFENPGEGVYRRQSSRINITDYFKEPVEYAGENIISDIKIEILNCPSEKVEIEIGETFEVKFSVQAGDFDVTSIFYYFELNDEYYSRLPLDKENHSEFFDFPTANEITYSSTFVEKFADGDTYYVEIDVIDEDLFSSYDLCKVDF